jgi:hypothetical protein
LDFFTSSGWYARLAMEALLVAAACGWPGLPPGSDTGVSSTQMTYGMWSPTFTVFPFAIMRVAT